MKFLTILLGTLISLNVSAGSNLKDFYGEVFQQVNQQNLVSVLRDMTGYNDVNVDGKTFKISERYSAEGKQKFRAYWSSYFQNLGYQVSELNYPSRHTSIENEGHNVEAVLQGESADSVIIIVHYDSMGVSGDETSNPAVDDDMTGMSVSLETARIISQYVQSQKAKLKYTIRFVAADFEEWSGLEGARNYAQYIQAKGQSENFKIIATVDNEQSGWNCADDGSCNDTDTIDIFSCSSTGEYNSQAQGDIIESIAKTYSSLAVRRGCIGENSDNYALWEIGLPSVVYSEHNPFDNPHFDSEGGDTFEKINQNYFFKIAQVGVTYAIELAGLTPQ